MKSLVHGEGSYIAYPVPEFGAWVCFDAARRFKDIGRQIKHSPVAQTWGALLSVTVVTCRDACSEGHSHWTGANLCLWGLVRRLDDNVGE